MAQLVEQTAQNMVTVLGVGSNSTHGGFRRFFSISEKRGHRTIMFLVCLTPEWKNSKFLKKLAIGKVQNN